MKKKKTASRIAASRIPSLIGRQAEMALIRSCMKSGKNDLLEGPVGVGKTHLVLAVLESLKLQACRVDGDNRYTEQKLSGWFDPPMVMKAGFTEKAFFAGPLVEAMRSGSVLFINELNRLPEGVQNVLLPAIDERLLPIPRLGLIRARDGFCVIATQNPKEFVATSHLSEAILDRFELITLDYQSEEEEIEIVQDRMPARVATALPELASTSVALIRLTRSHPRIRRGASIRAAISMAELTGAMVMDGVQFEEAFHEAVLLALPTRIELESNPDSDTSPAEELRALIEELIFTVLKKKS